MSVLEDKVPCVCVMAFECGSTMVIVPLQQASTEALRLKMFKGTLIPNKQTNFWELNPGTVGSFVCTLLHLTLTFSFQWYN